MMKVQPASEVEEARCGKSWRASERWQERERAGELVWGGWKAAEEQVGPSWAKARCGNDSEGRRN
jgi:hypothetical protein